MSKRKSSGHTNRSLLNHGPGKGDGDRTTNVAAYKDNLEQVKFSGIRASQDPSFERTGGKSVKHYGPRVPITLFSVLSSSLVIH
jgi:hypothetical protein